ncbi:MAG: hypothetical protein LBQ61_00435 [Spirochaetales bacterium]|jgi:hypothetical protein|nr:hypothetical protein [Spirochaetales bacterium]
MKINKILLLIALGIAALAGYGFFAANGDEAYRLVITFGSGISLFVCLAGLIAVTTPGRGSSANIKVLSAVFFILLLVENLIFTFVPFRIAPYVIVTGILLLVYVLIGYAVGKALENG